MKIVVTLLTIACFIGLGNLYTLITKDKTVRPKIDKVELNPDYHYWDLNLQNVYREIKRYKIKWPYIVLKQSIHEAKEKNHLYSSYNCLERNNLFGMKGGVKDEKTNPQGYKIYKNWVYSVRGYLRWQRRHYTGGDYYEFLARIGYADDPVKYRKSLESYHVVFIKE